MRGNHDDRQRLVQRLDLGERLEPVHAGHLDVEEDDVGRLALNRGDPLFRRRRRGVLVPLVFERHPHRLADPGIVIYQEDPRRHSLFHRHGQHGALPDGRIEIEHRQHVPGSGGVHDPLIVADGPHGLAVDLEDDETAAHLRGECRAGGVDAGDERRPAMFPGTAAARRTLRSSSRTVRPSGGSRDCAGRGAATPPGRGSVLSSAVSASRGRSVSRIGSVRRRPSRTSCTRATEPGCRAEMSRIRSSLLRDVASFDVDDDVVDADARRARPANRP